MSRSYRRTPKGFYGAYKSEKPYKVIWHQKMRVALRQWMHRAQANNYDCLLLPHEREVFGHHDFGKAGRVWFDRKEHPEWMRK